MRYCSLPQRIQLVLERERSSGQKKVLQYMQQVKTGEKQEWAGIETKLGRVGGLVSRLSWVVLVGWYRD